MTAARLFLGIDPGLSGALAVLTDAGRLVDVVSMPTEPHGKSRRVSGRGVRAFLDGITEATEGAAIALCMLEQVASRPGQGAPSIFTFGVVEGVLSALAVPTDYATPQTWKRAYGLSSDKGESIRKACDLIPGLAGWPRPKGPTHDQAEAVLLAELARRRWSGKS
ncbi:hypothetical protein MXC99_07260 [Thauera aromatica]|uniref:hypothetical protein n=1 Tax=Thauera aromatica TaxID=59405 RepID=UPI001FFC6847|nr:hypothetical protein [Thauera aromatica]MCK2087975.1 hypothetical protein [Thauera aromatica]